MQAVLKLLYRVYPAVAYDASIEALKPAGGVLTWKMRCYGNNTDQRRICEHGVWALMNVLRPAEVNRVEIRCVISSL